MLKLVQVGPNEFDLAHDETRDENAAVDTLMAAAIYTDGEAPADIVPDRYERRGWWANLVGNGFWYIRRKPLSPETRKEAVFMLDRSLRKHSAVLSDISVTDVTNRNSSPNSVMTEIAGKHKGNRFVRKEPL